MHWVRFETNTIGTATYDHIYLTAILSPVLLRVCPQQSAVSVTFTCTTDTGGLLWIQGSQLQHPYTSTAMAGDTGTLGYFNTRLDSIQGLNYTSTATTDVFSLPNNISNITIMCDDNGDTIGAESAVLIVLGKLCCLSWSV